ncbi:MAG TPA: GAF domain-containing protein [Rhizomicrobium sp.]|jgi:GAF domain-containing protein
MNLVAAPGNKTDIDPGRRFEALLLAADSVRDLQAGMQEILASAIRQVGAQKGIIQKLDSQDTLHICAQFGYDEEYLSCYRQISAKDNRACSRAVRTGGAVFIPDIDLDPDYRPYVEGARVAGYRSVLSFPIFSPGGNLLGVMSAHLAEPKDIPGEALKSFDVHARLAARFMERLIRGEQV